MSKRRVCWAGAAILAVAAGLALYELSADPEAGFARVEIGMSDAEVVARLGRPDALLDYTRWQAVKYPAGWHGMVGTRPRRFSPWTSTRTARSPGRRGLPGRGSPGCNRLAAASGCKARLPTPREARCRGGTSGCQGVRSFSPRWRCSGLPWSHRPRCGGPMRARSSPLAGARGRSEAGSFPTTRAGRGRRAASAIVRSSRYRLRWTGQHAPACARR
jgi:hypothetical protein